MTYYSVVAMSIQWINPYFFKYWQSRLTQLTQLFLFFWICTAIMKYRKLLTGALATYSYSTLIFVILADLQIPGFVTVEAAEIYRGRATVGGADPNIYTVVMGVAFIYFFEKLMTLFKDNRKLYLRYIIILLVLAINIIDAASRGGQIALVFGMASLVFLKHRQYGKKTAITLGLLLLTLFITVSYYSPTTSERWKETFQEGRMASREEIYPEAIDMIKRKPILGYGLGEHLYILGARTGKETRDTHNSFLWTMQEVGLVGGIPFLIGFMMCGVYAFKKRNGYFGSMPFALWMLALFGSLDVTLLYNKTCWFILCIAVAREREKH
jgi:O-antigen ligase